MSIKVGVMIASGSQGSLGRRAGNSGLASILHIRRAGPEVKGLTYQTWDSLFIYDNYPHLIHKATASGCCDSYTMETRGMERPMHHHTHIARSATQDVSCRRC